MHERWETLGPETLDSIRDAEGVPHEAVSASVSLDGVMVPLRAGEDGRAEASWREAACGTVSFHDARGERLKTLYLGRMPESGKVTLKAQLASEVAHIRQLRPDVRIVAIADGAADNWTFLEVKRHADALEAFTRPEPLPWADFFIRWGRAVADWHTSERTAALDGELRALSSAAKSSGLVVPLAQLERCVEAKAASSPRP